MEDLAGRRVVARGFITEIVTGRRVEGKFFLNKLLLRLTSCK